MKRQKIAKQIVGSSLVKTAIHGEDPNWGELLVALDKVKSRLTQIQLILLFNLLRC